MRSPNLASKANPVTSVSLPVVSRPGNTDSFNVISHQARIVCSYLHFSGSMKQLNCSVPVIEPNVARHDKLLGQGHHATMPLIESCGTHTAYDGRSVHRRRCNDDS
jgi:hypothetical protein